MLEKTSVEKINKKGIGLINQVAEILKQLYYLNRPFMLPNLCGKPIA